MKKKCVNENCEIGGSHRLREMTHVGNTKGGIEIWVYGENWRHSQGPAPHIHFIKKRRKNGTRGCLSLKDAAYFNHGNRYKATLDSAELEDIIDFLKKYIDVDEYGFFVGMTNYKKCCMYWNSNNDKYQMRRQEMPDYSVING